jgi:hypothetical protein
MKRPERWWHLCVILTAGHAFLVFLGVVVTFLAVSLRAESPSWLDAVSDAAIATLCLPLQPLVNVGRLDLFFFLLPANSALYGVALSWVLWRLVRPRDP